MSPAAISCYNNDIFSAAILIVMQSLLCIIRRVLLIVRKERGYLGDQQFSAFVTPRLCLHQTWKMGM